MSKDLENYQLEMLKKDDTFIYQIENPTNEMKEYLIKKKSIQITQLKNLTDKQLNMIVESGNIFVAKMNIDWTLISDEIILNGLKNIEDGDYYFIECILNNCSINYDMAIQICLKNIHWFSDERVKILLTKDDEKFLVDNFIQKCLEIKEKFSYEKLNDMSLPVDITINSEQWKTIEENEIFISYFFKREDVPLSFRYKLIDHYKGYISDKIKENITVEDLLYWIEHYNSYKMNYEVKDILKYVSEDVLIEVLRIYGDFISKIEEPTESECLVAIECDPFNIQYIKKPTDKMRVKAVTLDPKVVKVLDKKTKAVCNVLGVDYSPKSKYTASMYLVKFDLDLQGDRVVKTLIVKGKNMDKFMNQTFTVSFADLVFDDEEKKVSDYVTYKPISDKKLEVLKEFGLDEIKSGYIAFKED